jgi:transposase-like protein
MEKSSKRGKIPQNDWPSIISRYESGETLASIARTYDCSPPAISYIVSRTRARSLASEATTPKTDVSTASEPQLVKAGPAAASNDIADGELMHNNDPLEESKRPVAQSADTPNPTDKPLFADAPPASVNAPPPSVKMHSVPKDDGPLRRAGNTPTDARATPALMGTGNAGSRAGVGDGGSQIAGEARRTLHLPSPHGNGAAAYPVAQNALDFSHAADGRPNSGQGAQSELALQPRQPTPEALAGIRGGAAAGDPSNKTRDGGAFIDHALRERISDDIAAFLAAFDAALDHDTAESRTGLREATDRLLRAGARTRIELERLEARQPLPARDGQRPFPAPRPR